MTTENFIPEVWAAGLLANLKNALIFGNPAIANRNYTGDISAYGDTVHINSIGAVSVSDYVKNTDHVDPEVLNDSQQTLTIDQAKMFNFQIDSVDQAQQNPKLMSAAMFEAGYALANVADQFISGLINNGVPTGNVVPSIVGLAGTEASSALLYPAFVDAAVILDQHNCPGAGRWAVVSPLVYGALLKDDRFTSFGTADNRAVIGGRDVGQIANFTVMQSNTVPKDGSSHEQVLFGHNSAITFAEQISELRAYSPEKRFADALKGLHVYGGKVIRPELTAKLSVTAS